MKKILAGGFLALTLILFSLLIIHVVGTIDFLMFLGFVVMCLGIVYSIIILTIET